MLGEEGFKGTGEGGGREEGSEKERRVGRVGGTGLMANVLVLGNYRFISASPTVPISAPRNSTKWPA